MCDCGCKTCGVTENASKDPNMDEYKSVLKNLGKSIQTMHKTSDGKKLPSKYWKDLVRLLKKAKLGVSMMELGIDDEEEIKDLRKPSDSDKNAKSDGDGGDGDAEGGDSGKGDGGGDQAKKLAAAGLKSESTDDTNDKLNHLTILLTENSFESIGRDGTELHICKNERKFTIKYDDAFYMISEKYNFELGCDDINKVVNTFIKLCNQTEKALEEDYSISTQ